MADHSQASTAIFVGKTGSGKSQLCRFIATTEGFGSLNPSRHFFADDSIDSVTEHIETKQAIVTTKSGEYKLCVFDTPGLEDTAGKDQSIIRDMVHRLTQIDDCSAIVVVLDGSNVRFDASTRKVLEYFRDILGPSMIDQVMLAFSRVSAAEVQKRRGNQAKYAQAWSEKVCKLWGVKHRDIKSFYFNSKCDDPGYDGEVHEEELDKFLLRISANKRESLRAAKHIDTAETAAQKTIQAVKKEMEAGVKKARAHSQAAVAARDEAVTKVTALTQERSRHQRQMEKMEQRLAALQDELREAKDRLERRHRAPQFVIQGMQPGWHMGGGGLGGGFVFM